MWLNDDNRQPTNHITNLTENIIIIDLSQFLINKQLFIVLYKILICNAEGYSEVKMVVTFRRLRLKTDTKKQIKKM